MELTQVLEKIGLTDKESRVYLALLELGTASVEAIARKAGTKRPTTYLILDDLKSKGLVSVIPQAKKSLFTAESPENLISDLHRRGDLMKRFLPNLLALYNTKKEKPQVLLFQGVEGIRQIYEQIYQSSEVDFFGTIREVNKIYPEGLRGFVERIKNQSLKVRDLLTRSKEDLEYAKQVNKGINYEIRFIPEGFQLPSDSGFFADKVIFFSFHPQILAVMIQSREISQSLKTLYELAWRQAEPHGLQKA